MQKEIIKMVKGGKGGGGKGKRRRMMQEAEQIQRDENFPTVTEPVNE